MTQADPELNTIEQLRVKLSDRLDANKLLHGQLCQHDIHIELPLIDKELLAPGHPGVAWDEATLRRKLAHAMEVQQYHAERLERKMRSLEFDLKAEERQREELQQTASNDYKCMKAHWADYQQCDSLDLDDRIDKLSKVVAMIRGKVSRRIEKERAANIDQAESDELQRQWMVEVQNNLERSEREKSALQAKLKQSEEAAAKARSDYESVLIELKRTKERLKSIQVQYVQVCKREQQLNDRFSRSQSDLKKNKLTYTGKDFTVEIYREGLPKLEQATLKDVHAIRDFLESAADENRYSLQNLPTIPKLNFEKRYSLATEGSEPEPTTSNTRRDAPLKDVAYVRLNRNNKTDRLQMPDSLSSRSFYTKLQNLDDNLKR